MSTARLYTISLKELLYSSLERKGFAGKDCELAWLILFDLLKQTELSVLDPNSILKLIHSAPLPPATSKANIAQLSEWQLAARNLEQFAKTNSFSQREVLLQSYLLALARRGCSQATIKNYNSDIRQIYASSPQARFEELFTETRLIEFAKSQERIGLAPATIKRKLTTIAQFAKWQAQHGALEENQAEKLGHFALNFGAPIVDPPTPSSFQPITIPDELIQRHDHQSDLFIANEEQRNSAKISSNYRTVEQHAGTSKITERKKPISAEEKEVDKETQTPSENTIIKIKPFGTMLQMGLSTLALLVSVLGFGLFAQAQFFSDPTPSFAFPSTLTRPARTLSFQGRLTDVGTNPVTGSTAMTFRLFDTGPGLGGTELWSGTCNVDPDQDGIFATGLGDECGDEISDDVFSENSSVWLQVEVGSEVLTPRQSIKSVPYALNTETLQGYPASSSATANTVPVVNSSGEVVFAVPSGTSLRSTTGMSVSGTTLTLSTVGNGNITLDPDGLGETLVKSNLQVDGSATVGGSLAVGYATNANGGGSAIFSGNVGIGTTSPGANLQIVDDADSVVGIAIGNDNNGSNAFTEITLQNDLANLAAFGIGSSNAWSVYANRAYMSTNTAGYGLSLAASNTMGDIRLFTGGDDPNNERMRIDSDGNVGIGTTAPTQALDVDGQIRMRGGSPATGYILTSSDNNGTATWTDPSGLGVRWNSILDPNANKTFSMGTYTTGFNWATGTSTSDLFSLTSDASANGTGSLLNIQTGTSSTLSPLRVRAGSAEALFVNSSGNVGVGTTGPDTKLDLVYNEINQVGISITNQATGATTGSALALINDAGVSSGIYTLSSTYSNANYPVLTANGMSLYSPNNMGLVSNTGYIAFQTGSGASNERMRITSSGNVGIGTTSPSTFKLETAGSIGPSADNVYNLGSSGRRWANIYASNFVGTVTPSGFTEGPVIFGGASGALAQDNALWWDNSNKRLGIGTTTPGSKLQITDATYSTFIGGSGLAAGSNIYATTTMNIGTSTNNSLVQYVNGSARLTLSSVGNSYFNSGNVGIGTTSPISRLHISSGGGSEYPGATGWSNSSLLISNSDSLYGIYSGVSGTGRGWIQVGRNDSATYYDYILQPNGANVGIGTTVPDNTLHIHKASAGTITGNSSSPLIVENNSNSYIHVLSPAANEQGLLFGDPTDNISGGVILNSSNVMQLRSGGNTTRMSISATGVVNIDNLTASLPVKTDGSKNLVSGAINLSGSEVTSTLGIGNGGTGATAFGANRVPFINSGNTAFSSDANFVFSGGNLGIGTTSPGGNLSVVGASAAAQQIGIHVNNTTATGYSVVRLGTDSSGTGSQINIHGFNASYSGVGAFVPNAGNIHNSTGALTLSAGNATGTIQFYTAGTAVANERMRIAANGNVGIGTTNPNRGRLHIEGATQNWISWGTTGVSAPSSNPGWKLRLYDSGTLSSSYGLGIESNNMWFNTASGYKWYIAAATNPSMTMISNGNVGIGPTTPAQKLDVSGNINISSGSNYLINGVPITQGSNWTLNVNDLYPNSTTYNVGIGTTSTLNKLQVTTNAAGDGILVNNTLASSYGTINFRNSSGTTQSRIHSFNPSYTAAGAWQPNGLALANNSQGVTLVADGASGIIRFFTAGTAVANERMRVASNGNVGVGITGSNNVLAKMHIQTGSSGQTISANQSGLIIENNGNSNSYFALQTITAAGLGLNVTNAGNVGINVAAPSQKLDVGGNVNISSGSNYMINGVPITAASYWTLNGSDLYPNDTSYKVGIGTTSPSGILEAYADAGRFARFSSGAVRQLSLKNNDNSSYSGLILENTQTAANYGTGMTFNLGYGGSSSVAGTAVAGGKLAVNAEQAWTSTTTTQDSYMAFSTVLDGTLTERMRISSNGSVTAGTYNSQTISSAASFTGTVAIATGIELATGGSRYLSYYGVPGNGYYTRMEPTANSGFGTYGPVSGDWALYNKFSGTATRGWIWQGGATNVAGLDLSGNFQTAGYINSISGFRVNGSATSGQYLRGNGTNFVSSAIQAADVPTLNQDTTGSSYYVRSIDTRAVNDEPDDFGALVKFDFKSNSTNGLSDGGTYNGVMTWRKYGNATDFSGGPALQLAYTDNANLWLRTSSSATAWNSWNKIWHGGNDGSGSGLDADLLDGISSASFVQTSRTLTLNGTTNQITVNPTGAQDLSTNRSWTLSLPQNIHTSATPTFGGMTLNGDLNFGPEANRQVIVGRRTTTAAGSLLTLQAGGARSGQTDLAGGELRLSSGIATGTGSSFMSFYTTTAGTTGTTDRTPTEKMRILANGNVGIGTTSPGEKLDINGNLRFTIATSRTITIQAPSGNGNGGNLYLTAGNHGAGVMPVAGGNVYIDGGTNNGGGGSNVLLATQRGNVGIKTTTPGYDLTVNGNINATSLRMGGHVLTPHSSADGFVIFNKWDAANTHFYFRKVPNRDSVSGYTDLMIINNSGGISMPQGGGTYNNSTGAWVNGSDRSFKTNIADLTKYDLSTINKIRPTQYTVISSGVPQIGFIAQELQPIIPELVSSSEDGKLGVNYGGLTVVLTRALQELDAKVDSKGEIVIEGVAEHPVVRNQTTDSLITITSASAKAVIGNLIAGIGTLANLTVAGTSTLADVTATGLTTLANATVTGATNLTNVTVTGASNLADVTVSGVSKLADLTVTGTSTLADVTTSSLSITADSLSIAGVTLREYIAGVVQDLQTQGLLGQGSVTSLPEGSVINQLEVSELTAGTATISGLQVGDVSAGSLSANSITTGDITATGSATLEGLVARSVNITDNLNVDGNTTLLGQLTIGDDTSISGTLSTETVQTQTLEASRSLLGEILAGTASVSGSITAESVVLGSTTEVSDPNQLVLDVNGSARMSALEAKVAEFEQVNAMTASLYSASISGSLTVGSIVDFDRLLTESVAPSLLQQLIGYDPQATRSGEIIAGITGIDINSIPVLDPSSLDELPVNPTLLGAHAGFFETYLQVNGNTALGGDIKVGGDLVMSGGISMRGNRVSISSVSSICTDPLLREQLSEEDELVCREEETLYISTPETGALNLMNGLVLLADGKVIIDGEVTFKKPVTIDSTLLTNLVTPTTFDRPIQFQVAGASTETGEVTQSRFEIVNELGTPVATISAQGKAEFAGEVNADSLALGSQDLSGQNPGENTQLTSSKKSGKAKITAGTSQLTIANPNVSAESLIYVTPQGSTGNQTIYVKEQLADDPNTPELNEARFTIGFDQPVNNDVIFNWWVVN